MTNPTDLVTRALVLYEQLITHTWPEADGYTVHCSRINDLIGRMTPTELRAYNDGAADIRQARAIQED